MKKTFKLQIKISNDANVAALGEAKYGAGKKHKNIVMITLGTGVGSGIIINGELVYGHDGFAGELGHTKVIRKNGGKELTKVTLFDIFKTSRAYSLEFRSAEKTLTDDEVGRVFQRIVDALKGTAGVEVRES